MKKCSECTNAELFDNGYSDWTVEGTDVVCNLGLTPSFDKWYGNEKLDLYAENCAEYITGGPMFHHNVECNCGKHE